ncbi:MAG: hypothetical protein J7J36_05525 [Thermoplasmata archaeon]|nr:hypothetical protein [Thermoplasmata archaeon]
MQVIEEMRKRDFLRIDEENYLKQSKDFIERQSNAKVIIFGESADYDPANKRKFAFPLRPAIYME